MKLTEDQKRKKEIELGLKLNKQFFNVLDGIYSTCEEAAKGYKSNSIPLQLLKNIHLSVKKKMNKSTKNG